MLKIASWNCNSITLRLSLIKKLLISENIDILCLQETKIKDESFPHLEFELIGYRFVLHSGNSNGRAGVAVISKIPIRFVSKNNLSEGDARLLAFEIEGFNVVCYNFYVPAGTGGADLEKNPNFKFKLEFVRGMIEMFSKNYLGSGFGLQKDQTKTLKTHKPEHNVSSVGSDTGSIILGDINIAPFENDVYDHKKLLKEVSHTPIETSLISELLNVGFVDVSRIFIPQDQQHYTWWSYRVINSYQKGFGRRLDHFLISNNIKSRCLSYKALNYYRLEQKPSDHIPIVMEFDK